MKYDDLSIRKTSSTDLDDILQVERLAFGSNVEADLVSDLLNDNTAKPTLSLLAYNGNIPVGHILFSRVYFDNSENQPLMHILAPLAVIPEYQGKGIGGELIKKGLEILTSMRTKFVFVLGHESYYPKYGFIPNARKFGFEAPYEIPEEHDNAWMYLLLDKEKWNGNVGKIKCANKLDKPEYWVE